MSGPTEDDDGPLIFLDDEEDEWDACWSILGIEETQDTKIIRRAYADKLREMGRGRKADAFQRLRRAYEVALSEAAWAAAAAEWDDEEDEDPDEGRDVSASASDEAGGNEAPDVEPDTKAEDLPTKDEPDTAIAFTDFVVEPGELTETERAFAEIVQDANEAVPDTGEEDDDWEAYDDEFEDHSPAGKLISQASEIFKDSLRRRSTSSWLPLLDVEKFPSLDDRTEAGERLFGFFWGEAIESRRDAAKLKDIPPVVWLKIDELFAWSDNELAFAQSFGDEEVDLIMRPVHKAHGRRIADADGSNAEPTKGSDQKHKRDATEKSRVVYWGGQILIWVVFYIILRIIFGLFD